MDVLTNRFKAALRAGRQQIGLWCSLASPISTEIVAGSGFDWLLLDMEHSANDLRDIYGQLQAIMEGEAHAMVRVPSDEPITIKRILDTGAQSLMIPNIDDAEQARRAVAATRYAPRGVRGFSQAPRAARFGRIPDYHARCEDEIFVAVQIESRRALDNLEEIAGVEGVDGVFVGPGDLSTSLGYLGQQNHPEVVAIIEETVARITRTGKLAGILTANEDLARRYIAAGTRFTAIGSDMGVLARATEALAARFKG
ncbi:2,4-dihydroxyhept-2-ene-1,7-dioic acid aldolase [Methylobacterium gregans]|uniref:4-hydroxy-2-oxo-heptane-1,7-dioate aldolase n=1 Tax=Methylobacterium gregans TaxID=374424 RepID=A0AA37HU30_9HYPH|nr:HpcH/HpaI aldolase/citrate lyase family protein [Methylobacterium gregans]MDQ0521165.1 4-hydroxy-2-oxoheptanedioate aldolase [Methylobacterium gregans]GJD81611.1 4-hydroxy-2-oxo-heptane-1,7-dioate aldolase [Methylobacterium gregans]GLS54330.1 2,4-dihydroxyhept-2-ene-1,7-dioic acid aldolase [Methylobacterium gregans]